ncbi:probable cytochrome P450 6u1 [Drosophila grimshawi]|uniref:GH19857 n=1 Tax=Drosophila grimshawi TaxID=7222 RepID=B4J9I0_DROGR|nr:probable cytochrome P450 6u1 [Drosophila grimshawi]EDW02487.1 GH19857 [Drosophila grimshawi]
MDVIQRALWTALSALALLYALIKFRLGYWKRRGILHEKPKLLWGNIKSVLAGGKRQHVSATLQCIYEGYKGRAPFIGCYALLKPFVLLLDLELVRHVLHTHDGYFTSRGLYHNESGEPLSGNLLQLDGHKWRTLHSQSSCVFTPINMEKLLPRLLDVAKSFQRQMAEAEQLRNVNVSQLVDNYNVQMIAALAYGLVGQDVSQFHAMTSSYWSNWSLWRAYLSLEFPLLARLLQHKSYAELATDYFLQQTQMQLKEQRRRDRQPLQNFMQLYSRTEPSLRDEQIAAQAFGFILAGLTPLNATLGFCLYELALQPELQERVRSEIEKTLLQHNGQITVELLKELTYTTQVLNETLRLHTPYPFLLRRATREFELKESVFVIARGNNVIIPTAAIHRDPAIYVDPLKFDPDRFEAAAMRARPAMSFLPFGEGLRGCIAKQWAQQQLLVGLVILLQQHKYAPCAETQIPMQYDDGKLLLMPKTEIQLSVERVG